MEGLYQDLCFLLKVKNGFTIALEVKVEHLNLNQHIKENCKGKKRHWSNSYNK